MEKRNPIQHRMTRRSVAHDYTRPGLYHITMHVAETLGQSLGAVVGSLDAPDGSAARQPLFEGGYCDVMPIDARQLETQRAYIKGNPRSRLLLVTPWVYQYRGKEEQ